ncbi:Acetyltransferase [Gaiella occulta]|uniref:Acetyltransferase n=1 Tax=Gaiella occulta TaxID=1002870 RepID=A0A7M2YVA7_9ACTN|nr:GNAT family N-acetyltransferase [Gaiella occulta]RDI74063.1 Acetyltransferase [Gaiella occulta]
MPVIDLAALFALELRTPRLLLRLGDEDEVRALARLAQRGIHPPEEMPFSVAWSDGIGSPSFLDEFVAFHREQLGAWRPHDWSLNLLVWHGDELVGSQSLRAELFAEEREVATGSWLGRAFQRRGLGTEMRAAVLELAFRDLGAQAATSAWLEGNEASRRVSARLGYSETHTTVSSPRGVPVVAHTVRLERSSWRCPVPVRSEGLPACLPLFGLPAAG